MKLIKRKIFSEPLKRNATIYIGLPDNYHKTNQRYPVLYMQDGHNVFLKEDAFISETWQMLELYEVNHQLKDVIVVALNASNKENGRMYEYSPFNIHFPNMDAKKMGGGGDQYVGYLIDIIKPMIDTEFRTLRDHLNTSIMGSSMGGFIALYAGIKYPHVFGRAASLSGSFFVAMNDMIDTIINANLAPIQMIYLDTGDQEVAGGNELDYLKSNEMVYRILRDKLGEEKVVYKVIEGGRHSEVDWAKRLPSVMTLLFS